MTNNSRQHSFSDESDICESELKEASATLFEQLLPLLSSRIDKFIESCGNVYCSMTHTNGFSAANTHNYFPLCCSELDSVLSTVPESLYEAYKKAEQNFMDNKTSGYGYYDFRRLNSDLRTRHENSAILMFHWPMLEDILINHMGLTKASRGALKGCSICCECRELHKEVALGYPQLYLQIAMHYYF